MNLLQTQTTSRLAEAACPLCGSFIAPEIKLSTLQLEPAIQRRLQAQYPAWSPEAGACPECAAAAVEAARRSLSPVSLHQELLVPYPIYAEGETRLLPSSARVLANPNYRGAGVVIAFLDSGFYPHPDLTRPRDRILAYVDATGETPQELPVPSEPHVTSWHGLMTSCVAAGNGASSDGLYRGIADQAELVLVKTGSPRTRRISEADILRALAWVVENQARFNIRVVNISLGGDHPAKGRLGPLDALVEEAVLLGMVVVAAAGNDGKERLIPPASAPSAITVGGLDDRNSYDRAQWQMYPSNYGLGADLRPKPELIAPARWLAAPILPGTFISNEARLIWQADRTVSRMLKVDAARTLRYKHRAPTRLDDVHRKIRKRMVHQKYIHPHYQHVDGTSMAAPLVSAVVAQMLEAHPGLTPAQVRRILVDSALPLEIAPPEKRGAGLLNGAWAVALARRMRRTDLEDLPLSPDVAGAETAFYYDDPTLAVRAVSLTASFNGWNPYGYAFQAIAPGLWRLVIPTPSPGRHRYKFLVDGRWINDPENIWRQEDGYGGFNSLLDVKL